jgi:hypothetical protein
MVDVVFSVGFLNREWGSVRVFDELDAEEALGAAQVQDEDSFSENAIVEPAGLNPTR